VLLYAKDFENCRVFWHGRGMVADFGRRLGTDVAWMKKRQDRNLPVSLLTVE
jgi:hypothetical protein